MPNTGYLRIMCWNLAECSHTGRLDEASTIISIGNEIKRQGADVVLVNEVVRGFGARSQVEILSEMTGHAYQDFHETAIMLLRGSKGVGILSRFPIKSTFYRELTIRPKADLSDPSGSGLNTYGLFWATVDVNGRDYTFFSGRWEAAGYSEGQETNILAALRSITEVRGIPGTVPVFYGADFNIDPRSFQFQRFLKDTGLIDPRWSKQLANQDLKHNIDSIVFRGDFRIRDAAYGTGSESDHPWFMITVAEADLLVRHGDAIKIRHVSTMGQLYCDNRRYNHPGSSRQFEVTAYGGSDNGGRDLWRVKVAHGVTDSRDGKPVMNGDVIRLEHVASGRNLHSHYGIPSPMSHFQEVTCDLINGVGDDNDNWIVEVEGGGAWTSRTKVRLVHQLTNIPLSSSSQRSRDSGRHQEVCGFLGGGDDLFWVVSNGEPMPTGIGGYDLMSTNDQVFALADRNTGNPDQLVMYRPGSGVLFILKRNAGDVGFHVAHQFSSGLPDFDLSDEQDRGLAFDFDGKGKLDHFVFYRPGTGRIAIFREEGGAIVTVFSALEGGVAGAPLDNSRDQVLAFDLYGQGQNHLLIYRTTLFKTDDNGNVTRYEPCKVWIVGPTWKVGPSGLVRGTGFELEFLSKEEQGIADYDLQAENDTLVPFDCIRSGASDHLFIYRPETPTAYVLRAIDGPPGAPPFFPTPPSISIPTIDLLARPRRIFSRIFPPLPPGAQHLPPGIASYVPGKDRAFAFDYDRSGYADHIFIYRPGTGYIHIFKQDGAYFIPVYFQPETQGFIGDFQLLHTADRIIPFDYSKTGRLDHLLVFRPGSGIVHIVQHADGVFKTVWAS